MTLTNDITFSHLADAFIQSDLQMRTIEAIKINKRAMIYKCYNKSEWRETHRNNRLEPKTSWSWRELVTCLIRSGCHQHHTHSTSVCTDQLQMCVCGFWDAHLHKLDPPALNWPLKPHKHSRAKAYSCCQPSPRDRRTSMEMRRRRVDSFFWRKHFIVSSVSVSVCPQRWTTHSQKYISN